MAKGRHLCCLWHKSNWVTSFSWNIVFTWKATWKTIIIQMWIFHTNFLKVNSVKSVTSKRKKDSIFLISDISQVKTILLKTHIHSNELCPSEYSQNFCMDYFYFLLFSIFFFLVGLVLIPVNVISGKKNIHNHLKGHQGWVWWRVLLALVPWRQRQVTLSL